MLFVTSPKQNWIEKALSREEGELTLKGFVERIG